MANNHYGKPGKISMVRKVLPQGDFWGVMLARGVSIKLQRLIPPTPRKCWLNSIETATQLGKIKHLLPDSNHPVKYVEGWVVVETLPLPLEHGWLQVGHQVIETTLPLEKDNPQQLGFHYSLGQVAYYPALSLSVKQALEYIQARMVLPITPHHPHLTPDQLEQFRTARNYAHWHIFGDQWQDFIISSRKQGYLLGGW